MLDQAQPPLLEEDAAWANVVLREKELRAFNFDATLTIIAGFVSRFPLDITADAGLAQG